MVVKKSSFFEKLKGRWKSSQGPRVTKPGDGGRGAASARVDLPAKDPGNEALPSLWAREKIQALDDSLWNAGRGLQARKLEDVKVAITRLGIDELGEPGDE